jgi:hypothetical protein
MSSPEFPHEEPSPEREPQPYYHAVCFAGERPAGQVYQQLQELLYRAPDSDLSVYRLQLDRVYHVAVLGEPPPAALGQHITGLLAQGEPVTLPAQALQALVERRRQMTQHGGWVEGHHRPGERL